jgi:hypothetical protein
MFLQHGSMSVHKNIFLLLSMNYNHILRKTLAGTRVADALCVIIIEVAV